MISNRESKIHKINPRSVFDKSIALGSGVGAGLLTGVALKNLYLLGDTDDNFAFSLGLGLVAGSIAMITMDAFFDREVSRRVSEYKENNRKIPALYYVDSAAIAAAASLGIVAGLTMLNHNLLPSLAVGAAFGGFSFVGEMRGRMSENVRKAEKRNARR